MTEEKKTDLKKVVKKKSSKTVYSNLKKKKEKKLRSITEKPSKKTVLKSGKIKKINDQEDLTKTREMWEKISGEKKGKTNVSDDKKTKKNSKNSEKDKDLEKENIKTSEGGSVLKNAKGKALSGESISKSGEGKALSGESVLKSGEGKALSGELKLKEKKNKILDDVERKNENKEKEGFKKIEEKGIINNNISEIEDKKTKKDELLMKDGESTFKKSPQSKEIDDDLAKNVLLIKKTEPFSGKIPKTIEKNDDLKILGSVNEKNDDLNKSDLSEKKTKGMAVLEKEGEKMNKEKNDVEEKEGLGQGQVGTLNKKEDLFKKEVQGESDKKSSFRSGQSANLSVNSSGAGQGGGVGSTQGALDKKPPFRAGQSANLSVNSSRAGQGGGVGSTQSSLDKKPPFGAGQSANLGVNSSRAGQGGGVGSTQSSLDKKPPFGAGQSANLGVNSSGAGQGGGVGSTQSSLDKKPPFGANLGGNSASTQGSSDKNPPFGAGRGVNLGSTQSAEKKPLFSPQSHSASNVSMPSRSSFSSNQEVVKNIESGDKWKDLSEEKNSSNEKINEPKEQNVDNKEVLEGEIVSKNEKNETFDKNLSDEASLDLDSLDEFERSESFWDVLEEAGISKAVFFGIIFSFIFIVGTIVFFIFGGYSILFSNKDKTETVDVPDFPINEVVLESGLPSIVGAINIGREFPINTDTLGSLSGLNTSIILGDEFNWQRLDLVYYLKLVNQMQNVYLVNVYSYLDRNSARRESLNLLIDDIRYLLEEADLAISALNRRLDLLDESYASNIRKQDEYENAFFNSLDYFQGTESYKNLELFIEFSQDVVAIKAYAGAYSSMLDMVIQMRKILLPRYDDIVSNKEALIQGIRVFDIPDSDIEAIIPLKRQN